MLITLEDMCTSLHLVWNPSVLTLQQQQASIPNQMQACVPLVCTRLLGCHQMSATSNRPQ